MSSTEQAPIRLEARLDRLPDFDLNYGVDNRRKPAEITIYDPLADDVTTSWLTANVAASVDLADVA